MQFKSKTILTVSFLSAFLFSTTVYAQSKSIIGEWVLLSLIENGDNIPLVMNSPEEKKTVPELRLTKDSFSITPACNSTSGRYTVAKSGRLKFSSLRTTIMNCSREAMEMDRHLVAALSKVVKYKIRNKVLTLQDASGQNILIFNFSKR